MTQLFISSDGTIMQGMELPRRTVHGNQVNDRSIGVETGHPYGNYAGNDLIGPWSETRSKEDNTQVALRRMAYWFPLSGNDRMDDADDDDLPGLKFWAVDHPPEVEVALWTTPRFNGPWRNVVRVPECLFGEQQYRAWALLARWAAEEFLIPRNVPLYPSKSRVRGIGDEHGAHDMFDGGAERYREIVLADEGLSRSPRALGLPADSPVPPTAEALENAHRTGRTPPTSPTNSTWSRVFGVFRGFHGHGYSGDTHSFQDHDCPGPLFDWHRFAREMWDWWWWPFDVDTVAPNAPAARRPYSLATRDGDTPVKEYYWDMPVATAAGRRRAGIHGAHSSPQTFELPQFSRIHALANGELVAARFPTSTAGVSLAFMLVRHEVFHRLDTRAPNPTASPPVFANRIDYDLPPSIVYSLYMHIGRPPGMSFDQVVPENPDWLNRVLIRKKECELGLLFRDSARGQAIPDWKWNNRPPGSVTRPTLLEGWREDNAALTTFLDQLRRGQVATAPHAANTMPLRILLGDYLGHAGNIGFGDHGIRVEVFATDAISTDFTRVDTLFTTNNWTPGTTVSDPVLRYESEWARDPTGEEAHQMTLAGVGDVSLVNWWNDVTLPTLSPMLQQDAHLDRNGLVHHYDPLTFLPWLNQRTWRSEWPKYRVTDPAGIPARPRPR
jgi:hypothetical protein